MLIHIFAFAFRNFVFAKRNFFAFVEMLFWPIVGILTVGLMGDFLKFESNALYFVLTGAIAAGVLQVTQLDVGYSLLYDIWSKSLKHTFLTPAGVSAGILGPWIIGMVRGGVVFLLLAFFAARIFGFRLPGIFPTLIFLFGIYLMALLVGICVWILILMFGQKAEISAWSLAYLVMLLCGIYYPVSLFPEPFYTVAKLIPLTYFLEFVRSYYGFTPVLAHGLLKGFTLSVFYCVAALYLANQALQRARRTGLLARLSE